MPWPPYWKPSPGVSAACATSSVGTCLQAGRDVCAGSGAAARPPRRSCGPRCRPEPAVGSADLQSCDSRSSDPFGRVGSRVPSSVLYSPLVLIALLNSPFAVGDAIWSQTLEPPADSPKIVTLFGLPPNWAMLVCTQRSAAC